MRVLKPIKALILGCACLAAVCLDWDAPLRAIEKHRITSALAKAAESGQVPRPFEGFDRLAFHGRCSQERWPTCVGFWTTNAVYHDYFVDQTSRPWRFILRKAWDPAADLPEDERAEVRKRILAQR